MSGVRAVTRRWPPRKDGRFLYPLLEGPLWGEAAKDWEMDGDEYLHILEFDVAAQKWTSGHWKSKLEIEQQ